MEKIKILLINPSSRIKAPLNNLIKFQPPVPPLGIASLSGAVKAAGFEVKVIDQVARGMSNEQIADFAGSNAIDLVGISCLTTAVNHIKDLIRKIKALNKKINIVLGNIHPTLFDKEILDESEADFVVRGEGEHVLVQLIEALRDNKPLASVKGISFKSDKGFKRNPDAESIADLDELPFPDWSGFHLEDYDCTPMLLIDELALPVQASRGCAYKCYFCAQEHMHKAFRFKSVKRIVDEIEHLHEKYGARYIGFLDAYFPFNEKYAYEFANEMITRRLHEKIKWFTETRVDKVSLGMLKKLKQSGLFLIQYGFESGNQQILNSINKEITLTQSRNAMRITKQAGLYSLGLFILGLPGETVDTCVQTIEFAKELNCDIAKFNIATPYPGSKFFDKFIACSPEAMCAENMTSWLDWGANNKELIYSPEGMTSKQLISLQRQAMMKFHARPKIIFRLLKSKKISFFRLILGGMLLFGKYAEDIFNSCFNFIKRDRFKK